MILGLTPLGVFHTVLSLIAVASGAVALIGAGAISSHSPAGKLYVVTTVLTCLTGFGIFQKGGFGPPHMLGVITLVVIALAGAAERGKLGGRAAAHIATIGYSLTFFFHMIPGFTETSTRLPPSAPLASGPEDPNLQVAIGAAFVLFLIGATLQVRRLRANNRRAG
jgi:uncharacterized membrane protein